MLFRFRVRSDIVDDFLLKIDADSSNSLLQLHEILLEECGFDPSQLTAFYLTDEEWDKICEIKMFSSSDEFQLSSGEKLMKDTLLGDLIKSEEQNLIYIFDIPDDKSLFLELYEIEMKETIAAPAVKMHKGEAPVQTALINNGNNYIGKNKPSSQHVFDDLGELEDLIQIYGEMSSNIL